MSLTIIEALKKNGKLPADYKEPEVFPATRTFRKLKVRDLATEPKARPVAKSKGGARKFLYEQQGGLCAYCFLPFPIEKLTKDHIIPKAKGGTDTPDNLALACYPCNQLKGGWESLEEVLDFADKVLTESDEKIVSAFKARNHALKLVVLFKRLKDRGYIAR